MLRWLIVLYALCAVIQDLAGSRISNRFIILGWTGGIVIALTKPFPTGAFQFLGGALLPILLLFFLFYYRMIGAGDIKLLSALGGMLGIRSSFFLMICSFLAAGILSAGILTYRNSWSRRFRFFIHYIQNYSATGIRLPYRPKQPGSESLHFAVPVFLAVLLWKGGVF